MFKVKGFDKLKKFFNNFSDVLIKKAIIEMLEEIGEEGVFIVKEHINNQDLNWQDLSDDWLARKKREGFDTDIYSYTGTFYDNIEYNAPKSRIGKQYIITIGINKTVKHPKTKQSMFVIAEAMEEGFEPSNMPPRPLFEPSNNELRDNVIKNENRYKRNLVNKIKLRYL